MCAVISRTHEDAGPNAQIIAVPPKTEQKAPGHVFEGANDISMKVEDMWKQRLSALCSQRPCGPGTWWERTHEASVHPFMHPSHSQHPLGLLERQPLGRTLGETPLLRVLIHQRKQVRETQARNPSVALLSARGYRSTAWALRNAVRGLDSLPLRAQKCTLSLRSQTSTKIEKLPR